jgi:hypothetical protein
MAKKRISVDDYNKMTEEERKAAFFEQQGQVRPLGEPFLNKSGGISIRLIEQKPNLKKGEKGWLCFVHLPLHRKLATALLEPGVLQAIEDCIRANWQWVGTKEEDRPPDREPTATTITVVEKAEEAEEAQPPAPTRAPVQPRTLVQAPPFPKRKLSAG